MDSSLTNPLHFYDDTLSPTTGIWHAGEPNETLIDSELQSVIMQLQSDMPALGQTMVWERLRLMGFSITRERVRNALCAIDPIETALGWRGQQVHRQPYHVPGPKQFVAFG